METTVDEIADRIYRLSTFVPDIGPTGFTFNQFLIDADEPAIFHTGPRAMFPSVSEAIASVMPLDRLRWIMFGHLESDECGAMNLFLAAAPNAQVAHTAIGCMVSINDLADRPPAPIPPDGHLSTSAAGASAASTPRMCPTAGTPTSSTRRPPARCSAATCSPRSDDGPALTDERPRRCRRADRGHVRLHLPDPAARRRPSVAWPSSTRQTLAIMHGSSYNGDCANALLALADDYERRLANAG